MKGLLFDMDGTLLDSMPIWKNLALQYLVKRDIEVPEGFSEKIKEMTLKQALEYMQKEFFQDEDPTKLLQEGMELLEYHYLNTIPVRPHLRDMLDMLKEMRVPMAVSTATDDHLSEKALIHHNLMGYFSFLQTVKNTGHTKAEKEFWLEGAKRLGMQPEEIVVFEDALYAMKSAKDAGMTVIAIADETARVDKEAIQEISDYYLETYADFKKEMIQ